MDRISKRNIIPFAYIFPVFAIIIFVYFYPIFETFRNSLFKITSVDKSFAGLDNYYFLFIKDSIFRTSILNNLKLLLGVPILTFLALLVASLLFQQIYGWKLFRIIILIPYILSITVIGMIFSYILRLNGLLNTILDFLRLNFAALDWIGNPKFALYSVLAVVVWKEIGFGIILFLGRMLSIDTSIYDAAKVDGASWFKTFFLVTIPELRNVIFFYISISIINMLSWMFNYIFVMTKGGPVHSTYILEYYIYQMGIRYRQMGLASTAAIVLLAIAMIFIVIQYLARKRIMIGEE